MKSRMLKLLGAAFSVAVITLLLVSTFSAGAKNQTFNIDASSVKESMVKALSDVTVNSDYQIVLPQGYASASNITDIYSIKVFTTLGNWGDGYYYGVTDVHADAKTGKLIYHSLLYFDVTVSAAIQELTGWSSPTNEAKFVLELKGQADMATGALTGNVSMLAGDGPFANCTFDGTLTSSSLGDDNHITGTLTFK